MRSLRILITRTALAAVAAFLLTACRGDVEKQAERMAADTAPISSTTVPAGPLPEVPAADGREVMKATEYEITDENFQKFIQASEALTFLRARDMNVRSMLEQAGRTAEDESGSLLERLENHPQISQAIANAGMSVRDYYVMSIALAGAQRYAGNPEAAPATPAGRKNAEWAARNQAQIGKLRTWGAATAR